MIPNLADKHEPKIKWTSKYNLKWFNTTKHEQASCTIDNGISNLIAEKIVTSMQNLAIVRKVDPQRVILKIQKGNRIAPTEDSINEIKRVLKDHLSRRRLIIKTKTKFIILCS